ncbi:hypothetical protein PZA11_005365 [Diplocarpon coronariae]
MADIELRVVIEKLTKNVNESHLREIFSTFGQIRDLDMPMNRSFNTNRGTAYILYTSESDAEAAIAHMHESQIDGAVINVSILQPQVSALLNKSDAAHHSRPTAGMRETQIRTDHDLPHGPDHLDDIVPAQDPSHRDLDHRLDEDEAAEVEEQEDEEKARDALEAEEREVEAIAATAVMTGGVEAGAVDEEDVVADIKSQRPTSLSSKMAWLMQTEKLPENYQVDAGPSAARPKDLALPKSLAKSEKSQRSKHSEDTCVDSEHDGPFADLPEPKKVDKLQEQNRTKKESPSEGSQDTVRPVGSVKPSDTGPLGKAMKAEKSSEANDIEEECFDSDHGSLNTDPKNSKDAKSGRKSRFAKPRHSETHASESPLASSNSLKVPMRPKKAEGSRQTSSTEAGCHDTEHTSISVTSYKPKKDPKTKKARSRKSGPSEEGRASTVSATPKILKDTKPKQAAKSRDTNDAGERCEDGDHDSIAVSPRDLISAHSNKAQNSQEAPDENGGAFSQECSHADHVPFSAPGHLNSSKKDKKEKRKKDKREKRAEKKKEKKARREAKEKEKTVKQLKKSDTLQDTKKGESHNEDRCSNGNHQLASTDPKHSKPKKSHKKIAYAIENILDACAEYDVKLFRPNGFMMRLDMPGEEKYGLDLMDIYHAKQGDVHTDNLTATLHEKEHLGAIKHKHHSRERSGDVRHLESLRQKAFRSTRLILDPIVVLKDPELAARRGWDRWILACSEARRLAEETPPVKKDNKPWFGYFPVRMDRWPPSKHLYYERFRGSAHTVVNNKSSSAYIVPDHDSMDQRGAPGTSSILSCDEVEFVVLQPSAPESSSKQC